MAKRSAEMGRKIPGQNQHPGIGLTMAPYSVQKLV